MLQSVLGLYLHRTISVIFNGLDVDLSATHTNDGPAGCLTACCVGRKLVAEGTRRAVSGWNAVVLAPRALQPGPSEGETRRGEELDEADDGSMRWSSAGVSG